MGRNTRPTLLRAAALVSAIVLVAATLGSVDAASGIMWSYRAPSRVGRYQPGLAVLPSGNLLMVSGSMTYHEWNSVEEYNSSTNTWVDRAPLPVERQTGGVALVGGKVYYAGGHTISCYLTTISCPY